MSRPTKNHLKQRETLLRRAASLEQLIEQIDNERRHAAASYHDSELANRSIDNAAAALTSAIKSLSRGHHERVERLLNVTWFYAKIAQDVVSAEATEHILGRDRFLDLIEPTANIQAELSDLVGSAERLLDHLEAMIPEIWQQDYRL
jgi:hypothetical protein